MKTVIVFDSVHGNTEKIARAIEGALTGEVKAVRASEWTAEKLTGADMLIVGSPTYGGRATETMQRLLASMPSSAVKGVKVATFDTRLASRFVRIFGFAAEKIAVDLRSKGANVVSAPEGFFVGGREGPLKDGEEARAAEWARKLAG
jgi:flavodoxin I